MLKSDTSAKLGAAAKPGPPHLSSARFCASALNAKLDFGDETEEWHGLTTGISREKALRH